MAGFAAKSAAISARLTHTLLELPFVRIGVATGAGKFIPVIRYGFRLEGIVFLVAIAAGNRFVTAR